MQRKEAIEMLREIGNETPMEAIRMLCEWLSISDKLFFETIEKFRNKNIWEMNNGVWKIRNFLIEDFMWR